MTNLLATLGALATRRGAAAAARPDSVIIVAAGLFDFGFYLRENPDVAAARVDALDHFQTHGWREGRRPNPYFEPLWYRDRFPADAPEINPLVHYIEGGEAAGCRPIPCFDPAWYRRTYRVPKRELALTHFLAHRRLQRVAPNPDFDVATYVSRHARELGGNRDPFEHFLKNGGVDPGTTSS